MVLKSVSYAVLGQLAFRSWAAYELIKEMQRNFRYFFPKAESGLYEELKKLERYGLVRSQVKTKGKKDRAVYTITKEGNKQLAKWLSTEPDHYRLEFDGLLRVFLLKFGSRVSLKNSLSKVRADTNTLVQLAVKVGNEYLSDSAPAQSEITERVIVFDFLLHYSMLYIDWLSRTEKYLSQIERLSNEQAEVKAKSIIKSQLKQFGLRVGIVDCSPPFGFKKDFDE